MSTRRAYYADQTMTACEHCQRSMPARGIKNHARTCIKEPARFAAIAAALEDPARPGFGVSRGRFNRLAAELRLSQGQALAEQVEDYIGRWAQWHDVLRFFDLSYKRQIDDEAGTLVAIAQAADDKAAADAVLEAERGAVRGLPVLRMWSDVRTHAEHSLLR